MNRSANTQLSNIPNVDQGTYVVSNLRENNLKGLNFGLAHDQLIVVCGPSGSGKSTLAFDTIYAEGARRYIETFEPYTRQFLERIAAPDVDHIYNVRPALALEQRNRISSSRSTVGTITEVNDYLKLLWAKMAELHCPSCGDRIEEDRPDRIFKQIYDPRYNSYLVGFSVSFEAYSSIESFVETLQSSGFLRFLNPQNYSVDRLENLSSYKLKEKELLIVVDRIQSQLGEEAGEGQAEFAEELENVRSRMLSSLHQSYSYGRGRLFVCQLGDVEKNLLWFTNKLHCASCDILFEKPTASLFSYNSPIGACKTCNGFGKTLEVSLSKCIPNESLTIADNAIQCWKGDSGKKPLKTLRQFLEDLLDDPRELLHTPFSQIPQSIRDAICFGLKSTKKQKGFIGILPWFKTLERKRHRMHVRIFIARYRAEVSCETCSGSRIVPEAMNYTIKGQSLRDVWDRPLDELLDFFSELSPEKDLEYVHKEIVSRLSYLCQVGLPYLSLNRQTKTLSGGEFQRVNLTSILGSRLINSTLVLDEPTIGLHPRDTSRLIESIRDLATRGNSVVVVEHDPDVIKAADEIVELGPYAGAAGGEIVFQGGVQDLFKASTATGAYFRRKNVDQTLETPSYKPGKECIKVAGADQHNLKNITVSFPLNAFIVVAGVSGSGKSTLLHDCLYKPSLAFYAEPTEEPKGIIGLEQLDSIILVDQAPIGKSSRANAATYTKAWEHVRQYLAECPESVRLGLTKSSFSFNVEGGRCPHCKGSGVIKVEMQFLNDVYVECEVCVGKRFQDQILNIHLAGKNVMELLNLTIDEALGFFSELSDQKKNDAILKALKPMKDLGLGYLRLGQPLSNLSGGEAQRLKLASYMSLSETLRSRKRHLFILDEPTTGLHPNDIEQLLYAFRSLVEIGHSVICIEHNLDVIRQADWMLELGPEGGSKGGHVVLAGNPQTLIDDVTKQSATLEHLRKDRAKHLLVPKLSSPRIRTRPQQISIQGAREHNLKNINVSIPLGKLSVITGISGSGKSTIAFDVLFSEGQRRLLDCLSPYARQFLNQRQRPEVDSISGIPPTIAISQKTSPPSGISTLATITEVYQYLRLLYAKVGTQHCLHDGYAVSNFTIDNMVEDLIKKFNRKKVFVYAPVVSGRKGHYRELFERSMDGEIEYAIIDGEVCRIIEGLKLERHKLHTISLRVAEITVQEKSRAILKDAISQALVLSSGTVLVTLTAFDTEGSVYSTDRVCPECKRGYLALDPQDFSFRSKRGQCPECCGAGKLEDRNFSYKSCSSCGGTRLGKLGRSVTLEGKAIYDLTSMNAPELVSFLKKMNLEARLSPVVDPLVFELLSLLEMINEIGLGYLELDRDASTLSSGEAQRLRLAKSLGAPLSGSCYILDEPSVGLHSKDHAQLMKTLFSIRDQGNTVIVVEHDEDTIRQAEHIIDIGPLAGTAGGEVVCEGDLDDLLNSKNSLTGRALRERLSGKAVGARAKKSYKDFIELKGASANNLKNINIKLPKEALSVVCGVSGAGKSSLLYSTLLPAVIEAFEGEKERAKYYQKTWDSISIPDGIDALKEIDQKPIGRTPASTPASFLGIFDHIRKLIAQVPEARARGLDARYFSYNTGGGRCSVCEGKGLVKIPMSFLPDALSPCEVCHEMRYCDEALEVKYRGLSIGEILKLTIEDGIEFFSAFSKVRKVLEVASELGIGYLCLGQASRTLSGGEAQRLKIVRELSTGRGTPSLYILDEPTIGLHMLDVDRLIAVLRKLVEQGNTVVVIEHNLDFIYQADYVVDIGPGPADKGGELLLQGSVNQYLNAKKLTPTKEELNKYLEGLLQQKGV